MAHILFPTPSRDFDPTEFAVSWRVLTDMGHRITFATEDGLPGNCDPIMLSGRGLDPWSAVPLLGWLRVIGLVLRANGDAREAYRAMIQDEAFRHPLRWEALGVDRFDAILLGGGHRAQGMRPYVESLLLQSLIVDFFDEGKPVGAICHGVLLVARSKTASGKSVLYGRRTTALTWRQEKTASALAHVGRFWDRNYYRTYLEHAGQPPGYMSVQSEVTRALKQTGDFIDVPPDAADRARKTSGLTRDTREDARPAWVVTDGNYVSARWPGDAHTFAKTFASILDRYSSRD